MKTRTKALLLVMSALLLVVSTVFATLAYLTSTTGTVKNTFTVGNVTITLDEAALVDAYGEADDSKARVTANEYKLLPGHSYDKDPTVHVDADSEDCYIFVKVTNYIADIESTDADYTNIAAQMEANGWVALDSAENVYYYVDEVEKNDERDYVVFTNFKITGNITNEELAVFATTTTEASYISIQAYAIQADGFDSAAAAWAAAPATWNN